MTSDQELNRIYPRTLDSLKKERLDSMVGEFKRFCLNDLSDTTDIPRWLPVFLKAQGAPAALTEICHWEWLHFSCRHLDWGSSKLDPGQIGIAPGVQIMNIDKAAERLSVSRGLHVIYQTGTSAQARPLTAAEAICLDILNEDRKFTFLQLREFVKFEGENIAELKGTDWEKVIHQLKEEGILVTQG